MLSHRVHNLISRGPAYIAGRIRARVFAPTSRTFKVAASRLTGKGIEIGGPSKLFSARQILPVYPICKSLDGCNFGTTTVWEGNISEGRNFKFGSRTGQQFISDAHQIPVADCSYDFAISCHMLEHSANPIRALREWRRIIKPAGHLLLVLPNGKWTFDHNRPTTTIDHLVDDFRSNREEDDRTHIEESITLHDLSMSPEYPDREALRAYFSDNLTHRRIHHHVFDERLAVEMVLHSGFQIICFEEQEPQSIIVLAQKV